MQFKASEIERLLMSAFYYRDRFRDDDEVREEMDALIRKVRNYKDNYSIDE
jgi:hypothetical protein